MKAEHHKNGSDTATELDTHDNYAYGIILAPDEIRRPSSVGVLVRIGSRWANVHEHSPGCLDGLTWYGVRFWLREHDAKSGADFLRSQGWTGEGDIGPTWTPPSAPVSVKVSHTFDASDILAIRMHFNDSDTPIGELLEQFVDAAVEMAVEGVQNV